MTPARTNQNWLPGIFNEILGDNWLAERRSTTAPAVNIIDGENEYKVEVSYTQFQQSLLLPDNIERENISAKVENGVMTIDIPKKKIEETAAATRQIEVK